MLQICAIYKIFSTVRIYQMDETDNCWLGFCFSADFSNRKVLLILILNFTNFKLNYKWIFNVNICYFWLTWLAVWTYMLFYCNYFYQICPPQFFQFLFEPQASIWILSWLITFFLIKMRSSLSNRNVGTSKRLKMPFWD